MPQVEAKLGHLDPYFLRLAQAMVAWVEAWRALNPPPPAAESAAAAVPAAPAAPAVAAAPAAAEPARAGGAAAAPHMPAPAAPLRAGAAAGANPNPGYLGAPTPTPAALVKLANGHAVGLKAHTAVANGVLASGRA